MSRKKQFQCSEVVEITGYDDYSSVDNPLPVSCIADYCCTTGITKVTTTQTNSGNTPPTITTSTLPPPSDGSSSTSSNIPDISSISSHLGDTILLSAELDCKSFEIGEKVKPVSIIFKLHLLHNHSQSIQTCWFCILFTQLLVYCKDIT